MTPKWSRKMSRKSTSNTRISHPGLSQASKTITQSLKPLCFAFVLAALAAGQAHAGNGKRPKFDLNGDGVVTTDEVAQHRAQMFAKSDLDGDGFVTREEIEQIKAKMREQRTAASKGKYFNKVDADGDGKISAAESQAQAQKMAAKLDSNGDGEISRDEFRAMMKAMHKHQKGGDGSQ